jgi:hypothetical protein
MSTRVESLGPDNLRPDPACPVCLGFGYYEAESLTGSVTVVRCQCGAIAEPRKPARATGIVRWAIDRLNRLPVFWRWVVLLALWAAVAVAVPVFMLLIEGVCR